jgi:hypothetical protein
VWSTPVGTRVPHHADLGVDLYQVRQFPRGTGARTLGVSRENRVVTEMTKTLMKGLGYRGVVDMNYRFDERDGQYKLLDVNAAGLDLPSLRGRRRLGHRSGGVPGSDRSADPGLGDAHRSAMVGRALRCLGVSRLSPPRGSAVLAMDAVLVRVDE